MLHGPHVFPFTRCRHRPVVPRRGEGYLAERHRMEEAACRGNEAQFPPTGVRECLLTHPTLGGRVWRYISTLAKWYDSATAAMVLQGVMAALTWCCVLELTSMACRSMYGYGGWGLVLQTCRSGGGTRCVSRPTCRG
jgi:hypothetical protein